MSAATDTIARTAAQIAAIRSQERQQIEALTMERDGLALALAQMSTDFRLAARTILHTRRRYHALQEEVKLLRAVIAEFAYACEQVLGGGDLRLLGQALEHAKIAPAPQTTCRHCGGAHDIQRCPEVIAQRDRP